jgi:D-amino-acid dehydrogenase
LWRWGAQFLRNCTAIRAAANTGCVVRVALYARSCLQALRREVAIDYDLKTAGILHIYRQADALARAAAAIEPMRRLGLVRRLVTAAEALAIEPALADSEQTLAGGIFTPEDESGDAFKFTSRLAELCAERGVAFRYGCRILGFEWEAGKISGVATDQGRLKADTYVLALGSWSPLLARQVGIALPVYPAKGYSATLTVAADAAAPTVSLIDDEFKMVYSRLGDRLRCAGTAELAGWDATLTESRARALVERARALFPRAGDYATATLWAGLRPVTPDSVPILGRTAISNLFLNTGHGTLGWTMSCGSGKILADLISGRPPDIDMAGLGIERFSRLA